MKNTVLLLALSLGLSAVVAGCSKSPDAAKAPQSENKGTAVTESKSAAAPETTQPNAPATETGKASPNSAVDTTNKRVNLQNLPSTMVICTVGGVPVTVGDYQSMFKLQQIQLQNAVTIDPLARQRMLEQAKKLGISLNADETNRLLNAARQGKDPNNAEFKSFLKSKNITEEQFNDQVKQIGLAIKTANVILQQTLLNDLINRELLIASAKSSGFAPKAMNRYMQVKHSKNYDKLLKATGFNSEQLQNELVKAELTKMMMEKIQARVQISDASIKEFYDQHKEMFKHEERIRMSQILVGAPTQDSGNVQSVRTQVQRANPKLTGSELDAAVTLTVQKQRQKAEELLMTAKSGGDFKALANANTDDVAAKMNKTGGDLGWQTKGQLIPQLADAVWALKPGEVYSRMVQTPLGFHIIKVTGHEKAGIAPLSDVKTNIRSALVAQKMDRELSEWIQDKRMTMKIAISPSFSKLVNQASGNQTSSLPPATN